MLPFMPAARAPPSPAAPGPVRLEDLDRILAGMFPVPSGAAVPAPAAAAAPAAAVAAAAAPSAAPSPAAFATQLAQLHEMGFTNDVRAGARARARVRCR